MDIITEHKVRRKDGMEGYFILEDGTKIEFWIDKQL